MEWTGGGAEGREPLSAWGLGGQGRASLSPPSWYMRVRVHELSTDALAGTTCWGARSCVLRALNPRRPHCLRARWWHVQACWWLWWAAGRPRSWRTTAWLPCAPTWTWTPCEEQCAAAACILLLVLGGMACWLRGKRCVACWLREEQCMAERRVCHPNGVAALAQQSRAQQGTAWVAQHGTAVQRMAGQHGTAPAGNAPHAWLHTALAPLPQVPAPVEP